MEGYVTEEQKVEAIKSWWKSNGNIVIFATLFGLASFIGVRYYNDHHVGNQEQVSAVYDNVVNELSKKGLAVQKETQSFIDANENSPYASLIAFKLAAEAVKAKNYLEAEKQLNWIVQHSDEANILPMAYLRLARVQLQLKNVDGALATLENITEVSYEGKKLDVKGDIYLQQNKLKLARIAYQAALTKSGASEQLLKLKLNDLAIIRSTDDLDAAIAGDVDAK